MDIGHYEDFETLERVIRAMVESHPLPAAIQRFDVKFGDQRDGGDPAVWVHFYMPGRLRLSDDEARRYADLVVTLSDEMRMIVPGRSAYVEFLAAPEPVA